MRLKDAFALVLGVAVAALVGELVLAWFWPQRSDITLGMFTADPAAGYRLRAGYVNEIRVPEYRTKVRTDSDGFRVPARSAGARMDSTATPQSGECRKILAIGDSFTFGVGVDAERAFPLQLQEKLTWRTGETWCAKNGGVGGYGPLRSARLLAASQGAIAPEILVHAVYVGNDLEDSNPATFLTEPRIEGGRMVTSDRRWLTRGRRFLRIHSHLYSFLRARLYGIYERTPLASRSQYLDPIALREWPASIGETTWPACRDGIRDIAAWAAVHEARYLVVLVPSKAQVDEAAWRRYRHRWGLSEDEFDRDHPQRVLSEFLRGDGIAMLDLLPVFRAAANQGSMLYYRVDNHWTGEGHDLAAASIADDLASRGWLGSGPPARASIAAPSDSLASSGGEDDNARPFERPR